MNQIVKVLMRRDGLTQDEAWDMYREGILLVREAIENGEDPEEVFMDFFGLEPDYLPLAALDMFKR